MSWSVADAANRRTDPAGRLFENCFSACGRNCLRILLHACIHLTHVRYQSPSTAKRTGRHHTSLSSGVRESNVDGTGIKLDFEQLNRRKKEIENQLPEFRSRRPRGFRVNFGGGLTQTD